MSDGVIYVVVYSLCDDFEIIVAYLDEATADRFASELNSKRTAPYRYGYTVHATPLDNHVRRPNEE